MSRFSAAVLKAAQPPEGEFEVRWLTEHRLSVQCPSLRQRVVVDAVAQKVRLFSTQSPVRGRTQLIVDLCACEYEAERSRDALLAFHRTVAELGLLTSYAADRAAVRGMALWCVKMVKDPRARVWPTLRQAVRWLDESTAPRVDKTNRTASLLADVRRNLESARRRLEDGA